jgi:hypothetical protein
VWDKEPAQQSEYRNGRLDDSEGECEHASTEMARKYLRCISVERNQLRTDGNRVDQSYYIDSDG